MSSISLTPLDQPSDARKIRRLMARFIGGGYIAYFATAILEMPADAAIVARWWTPVATVLSFGPGWVLFAASFGQYRERILAASSMACGVGYLTAVALWFFAWDGGHVRDERGIWLVLFPGLASLAMVLARWPWVACLHLLVAGPAVLIANGLGRSDRYGHGLAAGDTLWCIVFSAPFVLAGIMAVRAGDLLDSSQEGVVNAAAHAAAQRVTDVVRARYEQLIHDDVLAVMINARPGQSVPQVAMRARKAMVDLEDLSADPGAAVDVAGLVSLVQAAVVNVDANIPMVGTSSVLDRSPLVLPADAAHQLVAAAAEAARNSLRHAGIDATTRVEFEVDTAFVRVTVLDEGCGFDPSSVAHDRMGVDRSIQDRMSAVGGRAVVCSAPGEGTRIALEWPWPR